MGNTGKRKKNDTVFIFFIIPYFAANARFFRKISFNFSGYSDIVTGKRHPA